MAEQMQKEKEEREMVSRDYRYGRAHAKIWFLQAATVL